MPCENPISIALTQHKKTILGFTFTCPGNGAWVDGWRLKYRRRVSLSHLLFIVYYRRINHAEISMNIPVTCRRSVKWREVIAALFLYYRTITSLAFPCIVLLLVRSHPGRWYSEKTDESVVGIINCTFTRVETKCGGGQ